MLFVEPKLFSLKRSKKSYYHSLLGIQFWLRYDKIVCNKRASRRIFIYPSFCFPVIHPSFCSSGAKIRSDFKLSHETADRILTIYVRLQYVLLIATVRKQVEQLEQVICRPRCIWHSFSSQYNVPCQNLEEYRRLISYLYSLTV